MKKFSLFMYILLFVIIYNIYRASKTYSEYNKLKNPDTPGIFSILSDAETGARLIYNSPAFNVANKDSQDGIKDILLIADSSKYMSQIQSIVSASIILFILYRQK